MERTHVRCYAKGERTRPRVWLPAPPLETSAGGNGFDEGVEPDSRGRLCSPWVKPFSLGNGFWRDAENGNRDGRAPQPRPSRAAKGSLGWNLQIFFLRFCDLNPFRNQRRQPLNYFSAKKNFVNISHVQHVNDAAQIR